jgi:hypothetical protein
VVRPEIDDGVRAHATPDDERLELREWRDGTARPAARRETPRLVVRPANRRRRRAGVSARQALGEAVKLRACPELARRRVQAGARLAGSNDEFWAGNQ